MHIRSRSDTSARSEEKLADRPKGTDVGGAAAGDNTSQSMYLSGYSGLKMRESERVRKL
jgi:hypothetical protein